MNDLHSGRGMRNEKPPFTAIVCPGCGNEYLHRVGVMSFDRKEDFAVGKRTTIIVHEETDSSVSVGVSRLEGNPSCRRGGMTILFWCENCDECSRMDIAQHKGHELTRMVMVVRKHHVLEDDSADGPPRPSEISQLLKVKPEDTTP